MPRCTRPGHIEFRHGQCVECRRKRQRERQAEMRAALHKVRALEAVLAS